MRFHVTRYRSANFGDSKRFHLTSSQIALSLSTGRLTWVSKFPSLLASMIEVWRLLGGASGPMHGARQHT